MPRPDGFPSTFHLPSTARAGSKEERAGTPKCAEKSVKLTDSHRRLGKATENSEPRRR